MPGSDTTRPHSSRGRRLVLLAVGALGASCVMTQLALLREFLSAFSGNELVVGAVLGNWLLLTGFGSWLGRRTDKLKNPLRALVLAQLLVALLPLGQLILLRALRNVVFVRGATPGVTETVMSSLFLLLPYCIVSGYFLTLACALLRSGDQAKGIGSVYVADSLGSIAGGLLFGLVLVVFFDHFTLLCFPAVLNLAVAALLTFLSEEEQKSGRIGTLRTYGFCAGAAIVALLGLILLVDVDASSTGLQYPGQPIVFRGNSPYGKLIVTASAGQYNFLLNGLPVISTHNVEQIEETVHYAMAQLPGAHNVLLVGGGISGTAREILKYGVRQVTYVELDPLVIAVGRRYLPDTLADARIQVVNTDGRLFIKRTAQQFDVVIVDVPDPSTSQLNRFYTAEFFGEVKRVLTQDGVLSFALGHYENFVSPELARMLASAHSTLKAVFDNVLLIPGGRVFFLASDGKLTDDIAARLEQLRIPTRFVKRQYLDAMLTPDRMADLQRATSHPATVNTDFNPMLYFYHLVHWMSQFKARFGLLELALAGLMLVYLLRLRPAPMAIFASGFAASALEVVLLLGFQVLYGSLYQKMALIVTLFMAGLAAGAFLSNQSPGRGLRGILGTLLAIGRTPLIHTPLQRGVNEDGQGENRFNGLSGSEQTVETVGGSVPTACTPLQGGVKETLAIYPQAERIKLGLVAFALAGFAALLPLMLRVLGRLDGMGVLPHFLPASIPLLTFLLAALVGMEFPLANRIEFRSPASTASQIYSADFIGACLGALLASTLLIPVLGVTATCLLTAGVNLAGGLAVILRKAKS